MNGPLLGVCRSALQVGVGVLAQSTLLLALGLMAAWLLRGRGPGFRAFVLQVTLAGVALGAMLSVCVAGRVRPVWSVSLPVAQVVSVSATEFAPLPSSAGDGRDTQPIRSAKTVPPAATEPVAPLSPPTPSDPAPRPDRSLIAYGMLAGLWAGVTGLLLLWLVGCQWHLVRLRRGSQAITTGPAQEMLARQAAAQAVCPPRMLASPRVSSPFLAGLWHPTIWLPATWETDFDEATLQVILAHELAHHVRRDCAWTLLLRLTCAALWMQPLLWLLARQMEQASEEACDLMALTPDCPPRRYADCLLTLAERVLPSSAERMLGASVVPIRSSVGRRIQQVLLPPRLSPLTRRRRITILATVCISVLGALSLFGIPPPQVPVASFNWAKQQGWSVQPIQAVNLASPQGVGMRLALGLRGDAPSAQDLALTKQCEQALEEDIYSAPRPMNTSRFHAQLQQILTQHPHFFYAEYMMSEYYTMIEGSPQANHREITQWLNASLRDAPAVLAERCEYNNGQPVVGSDLGAEIDCGSPGSFRTGSGASLKFMYIVTDQDGCFYLPVFRGFYGGGVDTYSQAKGGATALPLLPDNYVSNAHVGVLPPIKIVPLISLNPPFSGKAYTNGKSLRVHGPTFHLSWKPYPGAEKYDVIISEIRPQGSTDMLTGYDGQVPDVGLTTKTDTTVGLLHDYADFFRDYDYMISIRALDSENQMVSESDDYTFRPVDAQVTRPLTRKAIQDALALGGDAHIATIQRKGGTVTVVGTIPKSNWLSQPHGYPEIERVYLADVSKWQLGKEVSPGVVSYRMTISLPPNAKSSL